MSVCLLKRSFIISTTLYSKTGFSLKKTVLYINRYLPFVSAVMTLTSASMQLCPLIRLSAAVDSDTHQNPHLALVILDPSDEMVRFHFLVGFDLRKCEQSHEFLGVQTNDNGIFLWVTHWHRFCCMSWRSGGLYTQCLQRCNFSLLKVFLGRTSLAKIAVWSY